MVQHACACCLPAARCLGLHAGLLLLCYRHRLLMVLLKARNSPTTSPGHPHPLWPHTCCLDSRQCKGHCHSSSAGTQLHIETCSCAAADHQNNTEHLSVQMRDELQRPMSGSKALPQVCRSCACNCCLITSRVPSRRCASQSSMGTHACCLVAPCAACLEAAQELPLGSGVDASHPVLTGCGQHGAVRGHCQGVAAAAGLQDHCGAAGGALAAVDVEQCLVSDIGLQVRWVKNVFERNMQAGQVQ